MKSIVHIYVADTTPQHVRIARLVIELATAQGDIGMPVVVWQIGGKFPLGESKVPVEHFDVGSNFLKLNPVLSARMDEITSGDIVHYHGGFESFFYTITKTIIRSGKKISQVLSAHGSYAEDTLRKQSISKKLYYYFFERIVIKHSTIVHLIGPTEINGYNFYMEEVNKNIVCLPDGLHLERPLDYPLRNNEPRDLFVVVYSGALSIHEKGIDILLDALLRFKKEIYSPVVLWIMGDGADGDLIKRLVEARGLEQHVAFFNQQSKEERMNKFLEGDVFVQPSRHDLIPIDALEAASMGLSLIVSEETNIGAYVRQYESGWCLRRNTVDHLLTALHEAFVLYKTDQEGYARLQRNSFKMIKEALNWNTLAKKWKEVYIGLAK